MPWCKDIIAKHSTARAVLINSGQANAATGTLGMQAGAHTRSHFRST